MCYLVFQYKYGVHRSDAETLVNRVPVIEVAGKGNYIGCKFSAFTL
jgi:hypothetical protein